MGEQINLQTFSFDELKQLGRDIEGEMLRRQEEDQERFLREAREMAERYGVSLDTFLTRSETRRRERAPIKYRNPENEQQTWTGKGRQPTWIKDAVESGTSLEELEVG